jgi:hydrogenase maturation protein HypF
MLPYSPLHHLLLKALGKPVVATSGNISGEPVITNEAEAERRLDSIADRFVHHDRPIQRPADDPVRRELAGRVRPIRLGRGIAPLEFNLGSRLSQPTLAVGAFLKNTIALAWEDRAVVSPHIGDLGSRRSREVFEQVVDDLQTLYGVKAERVACDAHPDYPNTRWARDCGLEMQKVYHHHAHASAVVGEFDIATDILVFAWDGVGFGEDGTIWGGEGLLGGPGTWRQVTSFRQFRLPGADRCVYEPWRTALSLSWESEIPWQDGPVADPLLRRAWDAGLNSPVTSAVGRLFDAAAVASGVLSTASYDGEAPIRLEAVATGVPIDEGPMPLMQDESGVMRADWSSLFAALMSSKYSMEAKANRFHGALIATLAAKAEAVRKQHGISVVGLTGGVFQNRHLVKAAKQRLEDGGFTVYIPEVFPCNDGGISFGQIIEAAAGDG